MWRAGVAAAEREAQRAAEAVRRGFETTWLLRARK